MDGCPSTQLAARTLAGDFFKTNCRLAGRDFCHEVMVDAKLPVKTEDMWANIHHHWFDKQYSFSKQSCYSDRAREVLLASHETVQRHWKEMSDNNMLNNQGVPGHLFFMQHEMSTSYTHAPHRFVSIAEPWQMICKNLVGNMFFLATESDNTELNSKVRQAAKETFDIMDGTHALFMGLSTDMKSEVWKHCMYVQQTILDPAIVPRKSRQHLALLEIAFLDGGILTSAAHGSYTHLVLQQMRQRPVFFYGGKCRILGSELDPKTCLGCKRQSLPCSAASKLTLRDAERDTLQKLLRAASRMLRLVHMVHVRPM